MAAVPRLPPELFLEILAYLPTSPSALNALSQTNSILNNFATEILYRTMTKSSAAAHRRFFRALKRNPALAAYVRVYHTPVGQQARSMALWLMIREGILQMHNLKELVFRRKSRFCLPPDFRILPRENAPFQLEDFVWGVRSWKIGQALEFIKTQSNIRYLFMESQFGGPVGYLGEAMPQKMTMAKRESNVVPPPGCIRVRCDTWSVERVSRSGTEEIIIDDNDDDEARTLQTIHHTLGMKIFRTVVAIQAPKPYIRFQYTRQINLEDRPSFGGNDEWFLEPLPGRRHFVFG